MTIAEGKTVQDSSGVKWIVHSISPMQVELRMANAYEHGRWVSRERFNREYREVRNATDTE